MRPTPSMHPFLAILLSLLPTLSFAQNKPLERVMTALDVLQEKWFTVKFGEWDIENTTDTAAAASIMHTIANLARLEPEAPLLQPSANLIFETVYYQRDRYIEPRPRFHPGDSQSFPWTNLKWNWFPGGAPHYIDQDFIYIDGDLDRFPTWRARRFSNGIYAHHLTWALAWLAAADADPRPKHHQYTDTAHMLFQQAAQTWGDTCRGQGGGGIPQTVREGKQKEVFQVTAAAPNALFFALAATIANGRAQDDKQGYYYEWAERAWEWFRGSGMVDEVTMLVRDGLDNWCQPRGKAWTYLQGVVIGGLVELAKADSKNEKYYLDEAEKFASAAITYFTDKNGVLMEVGCELRCSTEEAAYKGIFIRNLQWLHRWRPQKEYERVIQASAESVWTKAQNEEKKLGLIWAGTPFFEGTAATHAAAMNALVAALSLNKTGSNW